MTTQSPNKNLCVTAQVIAQTIDGASERAVLVSGSDGTILHRNQAADHFLYKPVSASEPHLITDVLAVPQGKDWRSVDDCCVIMTGGKTTRNERNIQWVKYGKHNSDDQGGPCPCCGELYYTAFICSKHERVREIVDHAFDPVLTANARGIIRTANNAVAELFGYSEGELVGQNLSMICGGGDAVNHDAYMERYRETGEARIMAKKREVLGRRKDGTEFPCELDLTVTKKHEAAIRERQALMQGMINASFDSMLEIDQDGIIQIVNDAACHMFGYTRKELIGSNISIICGGGHAEKHASYLRRYLESGEKHIIGTKRHVKARRKDGTEVEVELGVQEVHLTSGKKAFCGFIRDVTAQKKDKRELRRQQQVIHGKFFGGVE